MERPIRVIQVVGKMMGGGVESTVMNHYRNIDRDKVQFDFIVQSDSTNIPDTEIESLGGHIYEVAPYKHPVTYIRQLDRIFRQLRPQIVHSHMNAVSLLTLYAAKRAQVPIRIAHSHSTANPKEHGKTIVKNILRPFSTVYPTHLAACSKYAARWLFGNSAVTHSNVTIIRNALDLQKFTFDSTSRQQLRAQIGASSHTLVLGQVGRLCFQKNQKFTLRVFAHLLKSNPDSLLVLIGNGPDREQLQQDIRKLQIEHNVIFTGATENVPQWYSAFDVLAFPSQYEGLGMAAIEAQATGLPVVVSDLVPEEAKLIPSLVTTLPISSSSHTIKLWADSIFELATKNYRAENEYQRVSQTRALQNAGYDIKQSATALAAWYKKLSYSAA